MGSSFEDLTGWMSYNKTMENHNFRQFKFNSLGEMELLVLWHFDFAFMFQHYLNANVVQAAGIKLAMSIQFLHFHS